MSDDFDALSALLRRWDGRRHRQELLAAVPLGVAVGLALGLAAALLSRARPWLTRGEIVPIAILLTLLAASAAALIVLLRRRSLIEQARFADRQFKLRERLTTAVEIQGGLLAADPAVAARQLQDALAASAAVNATRLLPLRGRARDWLPAGAALALLAVALWLPNPQEAVLQEQRAVAAAVASTAADLAAIADEIAANDALTPEQRAALQQPLDEALAALAEPDLSREAAVAALSAAEAELRRLNQASGGAALGQAMNEAGLGGGNASELTQALQDGDAARAGAAAAGLADEVASLDAGQRAAVAAELAAAAEALAATDEALAGALAEAAAALDAGDTAAAAGALAEAAAALDARAAMAVVAGPAASAAAQLDEARQAIAQAGSEPGEGAPENEGQEGVAGGNGGGQGGQQPGGPSSGGEGDGQVAGGATAGQGATGGEGTAGATGGPAPGGGHVENVYVPPAAGLEGAGQGLELEVQCLQDPATCGPVGGQSPSPLPPELGAGGQVPYDHVYGDYRDAAFESLAAGDIPIRLQGLIRDYFAALEP